MIEVIIMFGLVAIMLYLFMNAYDWNLILVTHLFSMMIGVLSMAIATVPFTPFFSLFFIVFQTIILYYASRLRGK